MGRERLAVHQFRARFRERAFVRFGKFFVKFAGQDQSQHGIAEKFQPLIVQDGDVAFVRPGGVREREAQEVFVVEPATKSFLKCGEFGHGDLIGRGGLQRRRGRGGFGFGGRSFLRQRGWIQAVLQEVGHVLLD